MNAKLKLFLATFSVVAVFSVGSFAVGKQITKRQMQSQLQTYTMSGSYHNDQQSTDIAVVNQDNGVDYNGKDMNYATDLLKSVDNDFILTNREAAKKGLEDGKYGAMVVLPGNFSKNITTINDVTPTQVEIYYEENRNLSSENKMIVSAKVSDFEKKINNKLSYMYVSSVFDELHKGQDFAEEIMQNDDEDLDAINSINNFDILKSINLTQLEEQKIDIKDIDFNKNFSDNKDIIKQIDTLYRDRLLAKEKDFDDIRNELLNVTGNNVEGVKTYRSKIENMTPEQLKEALSKRHDYNFSTLSSDYEMNVDEVNKFVDEFTKEGGGIDNLVNTYKDKVLTKLDENAKSSIKKTSDNIEQTIKDTKEGSELIDSGVLNNITSVQRSMADMTDNRNFNSIMEERNFYSDIISEVILNDPSAFDNAYKNAVIRNQVTVGKILKDPSLGFCPGNIFSDWNEFKNELINASKDNSYNINRSAKYKNVVDLEIEENKKLLSDSANNLRDIKEKLNNISSDNEKIKNDSNYKYMEKMFSSDSSDSIEQRLKLNDLLVKEIKINLTGNTKENLLNTIRDKNKIVVDDTKNKVQKEVEEVILRESPIDVNKVLEIFDKNYMHKFDTLIGMITNLDRTKLKPEEDDDVLKLWLKCDEQNGQLEDSVNNQIKDYDDAFIKIQENADKHVDTMRQDLENGIQLSQEQIESALENAKKTKNNTADSNQQKLGSLSKVLSNTRVGSVENNDVYNFIVSPASTIKTESLAAAKPAKVSFVDKYRYHIFLLELAAVFIIFDAAIALFYCAAKKRNWLK
ncbi:MAG TPA: hypothetical protein DG753_00255 [Clostridium sp.]|nr:hypothetical protein [Clostridium sp.]